MIRFTCTTACFMIQPHQIFPKSPFKRSPHWVVKISRNESRITFCGGRIARVEIEIRLGAQDDGRKDELLAWYPGGLVLLVSKCGEGNSFVAVFAFVLFAIQTIAVSGNVSLDPSMFIEPSMDPAS